MTATAKKWASDFTKPIDSTDDFLSTFHPDIEWYDHAFHIRRVGHAAVLGLYTAFTHCNQPFNVELKVTKLPALPIFLSNVSTSITTQLY